MLYVYILGLNYNIVFPRGKAMEILHRTPHKQSVKIKDLRPDITGYSKVQPVKHNANHDDILL